MDRLISAGTGLMGMIALDDNPYRYEMLIKRDTPKKPIIEYKLVKCGACEKALYTPSTYVRLRKPFCPNCGQRIDWSE